jgi:hypothetical protein
MYAQEVWDRGVKLHIFLILAENKSGWSIHAPITLASKSNRTKRKSGQAVAKKPIHAPTKHKTPVVLSHPATLITEIRRLINPLKSFTEWGYKNFKMYVTDFIYFKDVQRPRNEKIS